MEKCAYQFERLIFAYIYIHVGQSVPGFLVSILHLVN